MITPGPLLRVIISILVLSTESVSDLSLGGEKPYLIILTPDIGYSFSINPPWTWTSLG